MSKDARAFMIRNTRVMYGLFAVDGVVVSTAPAGSHHVGTALNNALNLLINSGHLVIEVREPTEARVDARLVQSLLKTANR